MTCRGPPSAWPEPVLLLVRLTLCMTYLTSCTTGLKAAPKMSTYMYHYHACIATHIHTYMCLIWLAIKNTNFLLVQKLCMPLQPKIEGTGLLGVQDAQKQITRRNFAVEKPAASYYPFCHIYVWECKSPIYWILPAWFGGIAWIPETCYKRYRNTLLYTALKHSQVLQQVFL